MHFAYPPPLQPWSGCDPAVLRSEDSIERFCRSWGAGPYLRGNCLTALTQDVVGTLSSTDAAVESDCEGWRVRAEGAGEDGQKDLSRLSGIAPRILDDHRPF